MTPTAMHPKDILSLNQIMKSVPGLSLPGLDALLAKPGAHKVPEDEDQLETCDTPNSSSSAAHRKALTRPRTNDGKPIPFRGFSRNPALQLALIEAVHTFKPFGYGNVRSGWLKVQQHMNDHPLMDVFERDGVRLELSWQLCRDVFGRIVDEWKSCDCYQTKMDGVFIEEKVEKWNRFLSEINTMTMAQSAQDEKKRKRDEERGGEPSPKRASLAIPSQNEAIPVEANDSPALQSPLAFLQAGAQNKNTNCAQVLAGSASADSHPPHPEVPVTSITLPGQQNLEDLKLDALRQSLALFTSGKMPSAIDLSRLPSGVRPGAAPHQSPLALHPSANGQPGLHTSWAPGASQQGDTVPSVAAMSAPEFSSVQCADAAQRLGSGASHKPEHELLGRILALQEQQLEEQRRFHEHSLRTMTSLEQLVQTVTVMAAETSSLLHLARGQN